MFPVVSIVGKSGSGKTNLVERLIQEFKRRGYRVATVKHSPQEIDIDKPGKDSWRFTQAGSEAVVVVSPDRLLLTRSLEHEPKIEEILRTIGSDVDLVLIEGFRKGKAPKIEVHRKELGNELLCPVKILSAIVTDESLDIDVPQFPPSDTTAIADFIEENLISRAKGDTTLFVNGKQIFIKSFVKDVIARVLVAMVSTLKGIGEIRSVDISIRKRP
jgi:molybdopterin-guanine dinucleotide biosynthesis protein MobB